MTHSFNRLTTFAALDIGSSKVCCVIAKISRDGRINIAGYGYNASKGIKNGIITDIDAFGLQCGRNRRANGQ